MEALCEIASGSQQCGEETAKGVVSLPGLRVKETHPPEPGRDGGRNVARRTGWGGGQGGGGKDGSWKASPHPPHPHPGLSPSSFSNGGRPPRLPLSKSVVLTWATLQSCPFPVAPPRGMAEATLRPGLHVNS